MTDTELQNALDVVRSAVGEAGRELLKHYGTVTAHEKAHTGDAVADIVTKLDGQTETFLEGKLRAFNPSFGFVGEEFGAQRKVSTSWLVDPIDGTSYFVRGLPYCTIMVALIDNEEPVLSVIYNIATGDMYWAMRGHGAFVNDTPIRVSDRSLKQGLVSFESRLETSTDLEKYMAVRSQTGGMVSMMCSGYEFAMVASGKQDGKVMYKSYGYDWDYAPGALLVKEAGGIVANIGKSDYDYKNHDFIAANPVIYKQLTEAQNAVFPVAGT